MSKPNRKLQIEIDLKKNPSDPRYTLFAPQKSTSVVWTRFQMIKFESNVENFAQCNQCKKILTYTQKGGTGSLLRHSCTGDKQRCKEDVAFTKIPEKAQNEVINSQLKFIAKDLRPLSISEGIGFKELGQVLINVGAKYGRQNIDNLLVSRRALSRTFIPKEYEKVKDGIESVLKSNHLAFTTDMWTDEYTQRSFLTATVHYVDSDFILKTNVLATKEFLKGKKTGSNIHDLFEDILKSFGIDDKMKHSLIVTDNGANVVAAFRSYKRLSCACHNLNLVMHDAIEKSNIPELVILIEASKKLVGYFKHSELNNKLSKSLKQHVTTRWNSMLIMLASIVEMKEEIEQLLLERSELHRISSINFILLQNIVEFLGLFKTCSEKLSADIVPTIHVYSLWYQKLTTHCKDNVSDSDVMKELRNKLRIALEKRFQPCTFHNVGLFLNPNFKKMLFLCEEQRNHIIESVKAMLQENVDQQRKVDTATDRDINIVDDVPSTSKKARICDIFDDFKDKNNPDIGNVVTIIDKEIQNYLSKIVDDNCNNVLDFWKCALDLPLLRNLSRQILNTPASSTTSERVFSVSGRILEERRTRLLGQNLDQMLFLNKNMN